MSIQMDESRARLIKESSLRADSWERELQPAKRCAGP